jgi:hypothetical protein
MELITFEMRELKASEGMVLTNGETYSAVGGSVYLGVNDRPDNWHEITAEEAEKLQAEYIEEVR